MDWLLATVVSLLLVIGLVGLAVNVAGSSRTRWIVLLGPVLIAAAGVTWHKLAVRYFSGDTFLLYGYFGTPEGAIARPWIISAPWIGVLGALVAFSVVITIVFKRKDAAGITTWWWSFLVLVVFSLWMIISSIQGDAAIFI